MVIWYIHPIGQTSRWSFPLIGPWCLDCQIAMHCGCFPTLQVLIPLYLTESMKLSTFIHRACLSTARVRHGCRILAIWLFAWLRKQALDYTEAVSPTVACITRKCHYLLTVSTCCQTRHGNFHRCTCVCTHVSPPLGLICGISAPSIDNSW